MADETEYTLKIDSYTPETMPMARLAEYMGDLARLLGEEKNVHFVRLDPGSAVLVHKVEGEAAGKIRERVSRANRGDGPAEAVRAVRSINRRLKEDRGSAALAESLGKEILKFPGIAEQDEFFTTVTNEGVVEGEVVRLGGRQEWIPVHLQTADGDLTTVLAKKHLAKKLAEHLWGNPVRVKGTGSWFRGLGGVWQLSRFYVEDFVLLDASPLSEVVDDLRRIPGSEWPGVPDAWGELRRIRYGEVETAEWS
jgi:hypothetical protein